MMLLQTAFDSYCTQENTWLTRIVATMSYWISPHSCVHLKASGNSLKHQQILVYYLQTYSTISFTLQLNSLQVNNLYFPTGLALLPWRVTSQRKWKWSDVFSSVRAEIGEEKKQLKINIKIYTSKYNNENKNKVK